MAFNLSVYEAGFPVANIEPLKPGRDWMEHNPMAHHCPPVSVTNKFGWGISLKEDVTFIFHGRDKYPNDSGIEVLEGEEYCYLQRGEAVIAFPTNLSFESDENTSILCMPAPNQFIDGVQPFTTIISSSFFTGALHVVWMVTRKDTPITIKAGTVVAAVIPINAEKINNSEINLYSFGNFPENKVWNQGQSYSDASKEWIEKYQKPTAWYKKAINEVGKVIGKHQVNSFSFKINRK